jgi:GR25 family glycosyltransferase involved in LPS biosynthesis
MKTLNIFFIHATWLKDREINIQKFKKIILDYKFKNVSKINIKIIEQYNPDHIVNQDIGKLVEYVRLEGQFEKYNQFLKNLHLFQLSNSLKHYKALQLIKENSQDDDINLILEDDVLFEDKIALSLDRLIKNIKHEILFLGLPSNLNANEHQFQNTKEIFPNGLPYNDSYIVTKQTATKLSDNYLPIKFINNIHLTYLLEKINEEPYLAIPNLFIDGSRFGSHLSVLTANNTLLFNNEYMQAKTNIDTYDFSKETPLNNHPEYMYLKALNCVKNKKYDEAIELYKKALEIYKANNCIINNECQFLKDYTRVFKYIDYNHH